METFEADAPAVPVATPTWPWALTTPVMAVVMAGLGIDLRAEDIIEQEIGDAYGYRAISRIRLHWRGQPWRDTDEQQESGPWLDRVAEARRALGDDGAPVVFFEHGGNGVYGVYGADRQYLVALSRDGLRAAAVRLR
jgi:hypothetical protein